jgi:general secretion pathway protein F
MPVFIYKGIDAKGTAVSGELDAATRKHAVQKLTHLSIQATQLTPKHIEEVSKATGNADFFAQKRETTEEPQRRILFQRKIAGKELALSFLKKLLILLTSGLQLGDALRLMNLRLSDPALKDLANKLWKKISEGRTLTHAMAEMPEIFPESIIHLIDAGESSGNLVPIIKRIVTYLEETAALKRKIIGNLAYPAFVIFLAFGVVGFFIMFLLPRIRGMIETLGGDMPLITRILIGSADMLVSYGWIAAIMVIGAMIALSNYRKTTKGRAQTDLWLLNLPIVGNLYLLSNIFQTSNLMATLINSGVNTTEVLRLVERTITNIPLRSKFNGIRKQIQEGVSMATAFKRAHFMPDLAMDIMTVGENTGNVAQSLLDINGIYQEELSQKLSRLSTIISSAALFFAFALVGIIALSIVYSVFAVSNSLKL